jgi:hypothetical protein
MFLQSTGFSWVLLIRKSPTEVGTLNAEQVRNSQSLLDTNRRFPYDHTLRQGKGGSDF